MTGLRDFLNTKSGQGVGIGLCVVALAAAVYLFRGSFGTSADAAATNSRIFVDSQTGQSFQATIRAGMTVPITAPSGGQTGYPAELCYWNKDGTVRSQPYPVLLNTWIGKSEPTFCPDCGRLVVAHNPGAGPGITPPPTETEYKLKPLQPDRDR